MQGTADVIRDAGGISADIPELSTPGLSIFWPVELSRHHFRICSSILWASSSRGSVSNLIAGSRPSSSR